MLTLPSAYSVTVINQDWTLDSDFNGALRIQGNGANGLPLINLNGHKITLDSGGLAVASNTSYSRWEGDTITSTESFLEVKMESNGRNNCHTMIESVLADSDHKVGLRITGGPKGDSGLYLGGAQSNTFTGNVEISGYRKHLALNKTNGAIAVRGNILVKDNAILSFENSNQLLQSSEVTLKSRGVLQLLNANDMKHVFRSLTIENSGIVDFLHTHPNESKGASFKNHIYLDHLIIKNDGNLLITGWKNERDFLLVRKDSPHLSDALKKITFEGYAPGNVHIEDFNSEYWSISGLPEPSTYGAIFGAAAVLALWHRRRRHRRKHALTHDSRRLCAAQNTQITH